MRFIKLTGGIDVGMFEYLARRPDSNQELLVSVALVDDVDKKGMVGVGGRNPPQHRLGNTPSAEFNATSV